MRVRATLTESFNFNQYDKEMNPFKNGLFESKYDKKEVEKQLKELKDAYDKYIDKYIKLEVLTYGNYQGENSSILDELKKVLSNESTTKNLATKLFQDKTYSGNNELQLRQLMEQYDTSYKDFYDKMTKNMIFLEDTTSALRNEIVLHHFGLTDGEGFLKEFSLDSKSISKLFEQGALFKVQVEKENGVYKATLKTKGSLTRGTIINELSEATKRQQTFNRTGIGEIVNSQSLKELFSTTYGNINRHIYRLKDDGSLGKSIGNLGRRYEMFEHGLLSDEGVQKYFESIKGKKGTGYYLDQLPWVSGGDNFYEDAIGRRYNISNKFFNIPKIIKNAEGKYVTNEKNENALSKQFDLTSITTLFDALDTLTKPEMIAQKYNKYSEAQFKSMSKDQLITEYLEWNSKSGHHIYSQIQGLQSPYLTIETNQAIRNEIEASNSQNIDEYLSIIFNHTIDQFTNDISKELDIDIDEDEEN